MECDCCLCDTSAQLNSLSSDLSSSPCTCIPFIFMQEGVECDGCWSETFLQFTDAKPRGPQAMSLDISFPGFEHVYGLPERATSFALKPTPGEIG